MLHTLIKNNLKLMLRSKWILVLMIGGPILIIAVLGSVFDDLMKSYEGLDEFMAGYRLEDESAFSPYMQEVKRAAEDNGVTFVEYESGDIEDIIAKNDCAVFIDFQAEAYIIYQIQEHETESHIAEYFLNGVSASMLGADGADLRLDVVQLDIIPNIESEDYYGIAYTIYFIWCSFVCLTAVITSERKGKANQKYKISLISNISLYLGKAIPCALMTVIGVGTSTLLSTYLFQIKWGNYPMTILILLLTVLASTVMGLFFCLLFRSLTYSICTSFMVTWVAGFVGGSFETYIYSTIDQSVKVLSPIYHATRALTEYSVQGHSEYTRSTIIYLTGLMVIFALLGIGMNKLRKEEEA